MSFIKKIKRRVIGFTVKELLTDLQGEEVDIGKGDMIFVSQNHIGLILSK